MLFEKIKGVDGEVLPVLWSIQLPSWHAPPVGAIPAGRDRVLYEILMLFL
jgi:hypothetical protein